ncbi:MAG: C1 family peptidase [Bacteroidota bacterium]
MKNKKKYLIHFIILFIFSFQTGNIKSQIHPDFTIIKQVPTSPVKSQDRTGTCWSYATTSFIETEALRKGKGLFDLSEMYFARNAYTTKAKKYVRFHGNNNFSESGQAHDVLDVIKTHGIVPQEVYQGLNYGRKKHNHSEMYSVLNGMLKGLLKSKMRPHSDVWLPSFNAILDNCLGENPKDFKYKGKTYTPQNFAKNVIGFNPDDYVELSSYKDYPFYKQFELEVPDNWSHDLYYNLPINEFMQVMDNALNNGYSVDWDGDVSEDDYSNKAGTAVLSMDESDGIIINGLDKMRLQTFEDFSTTDDHLMHITGIAKDKNGTIFYLTKNSGGPNRNNFGGYLYMSKSYVQLKTIAILVHKDALPKDIKKKMGIK